MSNRKLRITLTLDPQLVEHASAHVRAGAAGSLSEWVNGLIAEHAEAEKRERAARRAAAAYARSFGKLSSAEVARELASLRRAAVRVRPAKARVRAA